MTATSTATARRILVSAGVRGCGGRAVTVRLRWVMLLTIAAILVPGQAWGEQASEPGSRAAAQLDAGANFSCAIVTGDQVRCWGYGADGELGYPGITEVGAGDTPASVGPVDIGTGYTAKAISSGDFHTCVIRNDGRVVCWGYGADGRLGYGNTNNIGYTQTPGSAGPVNLGPGHTATAISAGGSHTCAILNDNSVRCWGYGGDGALGYGNTNNIANPNAGQPLSMVACASPSLCTAVDQSLRQVTFNPATPGNPSATPVDTGEATLGGVACPLASQCTIVANAVQTQGVTSGQEVTFNPAVPGSEKPATVDTNVLSGLACPSATQCSSVDNSQQQVTFNPATGASVKVAAIVSGSYKNVPIGLACPTATQCTAIDTFGQEVTFIPSTGVAQKPAAIDTGKHLIQVACATARQCTAIDTLGREVTFDPTAPGAPTPITIGAANSLSAVACPTAATNQCTAVYGSGQEVTFTPATGQALSRAPIDAGHSLSAIACPTTSQCTAVDGSGRQVTFTPATGAILTQSTVDTVGPVFLGLGRTAKAISAGTRYTCAILDTGNVACWGSGGDGELGYGNTTNVGDGVTPNSATPPDPSVAAAGTVDLGGHTAVAISAGGDHTCAILDDASVRCWGYGFNGQLGYGSQSNVGDSTADPTPATAGPVNLGAGRKALAITAGGAHTCAIRDDHSVLCWGYGLGGRLGYGNTSNVGENPSDTPGTAGPVNLGAGRTALAISAGGMHTCARLDDGTTVRCWGYGAYGQLGYCSHSNVGDAPTDTPDTAGPVNLTPGDGGELCPTTITTLAVVPRSTAPPSISGQAVAGKTLTEAHGSWSPTPTSYAYQWERCDRAGANCLAVGGANAQSYRPSEADAGSTIRVQETASNPVGAGVPATSSQTTAVAHADAARARGFRSCLAAVTRHAKHARALTHHGSARRRAQARHRLARQLNKGRRQCVRRWGRTPGKVTGLRATTRSKTKIELHFIAPGTDGKNIPAATTYVIKQSFHPIHSQRQFNTSPALCHVACRFTVTQIGTKITLTVVSLHPRTTYYYAIAALDNVTGRPGPRSRSVRIRTR